LIIEQATTSRRPIGNKVGRILTRSWRLLDRRVSRVSCGGFDNLDGATDDQEGDQGEEES
jgi:hypothetical protein